MSTFEPTLNRPLADERGDAARPRQGRRRRTALLSLGLIGLLLVASIGAGAFTFHRQQDERNHAVADRVEAEHLLGAVLAQARADGVVDQQLLYVTTRERVILAEAAVGDRLHWFDAGETSHVGQQTSALRQLLPAVDKVEQAATQTERERSEPVLARWDQAIGDAHGAGLDIVAEQQHEALVRQQLKAAHTPKAALTAISGIEQHALELQGQARSKLAADQALAQSRGDAQSAIATAETLLGQAKQYPQLQVQSFADQIAAAHQALAAANSVETYDAVTSSVGDTIGGLRALLGARSDAFDEMAYGRRVVDQARAAGIDSSSQSAQLDQIQGQLNSAGTTGQFRAVISSIDGVVQPLADRLGIVNLGPGKVIVISLGNQSLTAYNDGQPWLSTPVTTGRPALPTPAGTFSVVRKNSPWTMHSDFPPDSPYWYPDTQVNWVLWFTNQGHGIHDAPWRSSYGPGTQASGSHGCVNVPAGAESQLYSWADIGTRVIIH